jgi:hypothetical protein
MRFFGALAAWRQPQRRWTSRDCSAAWPAAGSERDHDFSAGYARLHVTLGEDYNILVMTRIREEARALPLREVVGNGGAGGTLRYRG